jgi:Ca2+-binding RTX toxin-like protein
MIRPLLGALALLALAAPAASATSDAEIFATNNTAVITDPADPRLQDRLNDFARQVERIVSDGGGVARGSQLLDGVFSFDGVTTFERSREFDVDRVSEDELHTIADTIRARFDQQSVLTFDRLPASSDDVDAVLLDVPGVTATALRDGLLNDVEARERLFGGSVTQDKHLLLVASLDDATLARTFAKRIGGDLKRASTTYGKREFVEGPLPVRVERGTLVVAGSADDDAIELTRRAGRIEVKLGGETFAFARHRVDRVRVDGGDGLDTFAIDDRRLDLKPAGDHVRIGDVDLDGVEIVKATADELNVGDLSATDVFQVDADADRTTTYGSEGDDQISFGSFGVLGPTFVQLVNPSLDRYLTIDGRGGDDIISSSSAAVDLTLVGGSGDNVLIGGPGDDHLIGGDGFDDVSGGKGEDVAFLGGGFDRFSWKPGDSSDVVDGGASRDSLSFTGTNDPEAYSLAADGRGLRFTVGDVALALAGLEEIDPVLGGGEDTFAIGALRRTDAQLVDISLAGVPITAGGDGAADRVTVAGTDKADALKLVGKVVVGGTATLTGLPWTVNVSHAEAADALVVNGGAGKDTLDTAGFAPGTIGLSFVD